MFDNVTIDLSYLSCADEPEPSSTSSPTVIHEDEMCVEEVRKEEEGLLC